VIEPTDEMRTTAYRTAREWAVQHRHALPDDRMLDSALAAVLAIAARDRCMERRGHVFHPLDRKWPAGRGGSHPHYCVGCSDGEAPGPGCGDCRSTGMDQTPWPQCQECRS
jgi:hypothetical protein